MQAPHAMRVVLKWSGQVKNNRKSCKRSKRAAERAETVQTYAFAGSGSKTPQ